MGSGNGRPTGCLPFGTETGQGLAGFAGLLAVCLLGGVCFASREIARGDQFGNCGGQESVADAGHRSL